MIPLDKIVNLALACGFHACGVSKVERLVGSEPYLLNWLNNGYHADMGYMARNVNLRFNPTLLIPNAKSVISVLLSYKSMKLPINREVPKIARYACGSDYHGVMKNMLYSLLNAIRAEFGEINGRAFVDSAPVLEREWAVRAGLGWIGKNSNLIHPRLGSFVFIGELIVDADVETIDNVERNRCGTCTRCIDACPTQAIIVPKVVDARKCISYLSIEKREPLNEDEKEMLNGWCFGCDICQQVCPWNKKGVELDCQNFKKENLVGLRRDDLAQMSETDFDVWFSGTPLKRAGYTKVKAAVDYILKKG